MSETIDQSQGTAAVAASDLSTRSQPDEANLFAPLRLCMLPNGMQVAYQSKAELTHFYEDIFEKHVYLKHGVSLHDGECVFDVGANIGLFTLFSHRKVNNLRIYAFEPAPPLFRILSFNTTLHKVNARLFNCGISDLPKMATFTFYPQSSGMSSFYGNKQEEKDALRAIMRNQLEAGMEGMDQLMRHSEDLLEERFRSELFDCQLRPLSEIIQEQSIERIDLLKIDVQKSELDVLTGIAAGDWPKIRQIVIEVHDVGGRLGDITEILKHHGFNVKTEQDHMYKGSVLYNLFAARPFLDSSIPALARMRMESSSIQHIQDRAKKREAVISQQKRRPNPRRKTL